MWRFEMCEVGAGEFAQFFFGRMRALLEYNKSMRRFAPTFIGEPDDRDFLHGWVS